MTDPNAVVSTLCADEAIAQFLAEPEKKQLATISTWLEAGDRGLDALMAALQHRQAQLPTLVDGKLYQSLYASSNPKARDFLQTVFPHGLIPLVSDRQIDYQLLQKLLAQQDFETADSVTRQKFCELAGEGALQRKWVYFTEVEQFPITDLQTIDRLWWLHSEGKFGFSIQRKLWIALGRDFVKLWPAIGWKNGNSWTQYPNGFTWDLSAPTGHLPLLNQLRGVRVADSLYNHPVWSTL
jgi:hypothetical protein